MKKESKIEINTSANLILKDKINSKNLIEENIDHNFILEENDTIFSKSSKSTKEILNLKNKTNENYHLKK